MLVPPLSLGASCGGGIDWSCDPRPVTTGVAMNKRAMACAVGQRQSTTCMPVKGGLFFEQRFCWHNAVGTGSQTFFLNKNGRPVCLFVLLVDLAI